MASTIAAGHLDLAAPGGLYDLYMPPVSRNRLFMRFVMSPDMVYQYPIWAVGLLLVGAAVFGAILLELCARRLLPIELRRRHNDVAAAIFSIIGVTYAVLLAFVAMLAWEGFNRAKAASYAEAARIGNVYNLSAGFADPEKSSIRNEISGMRDVW